MNPFGRVPSSRPTTTRLTLRLSVSMSAQEDPEDVEEPASLRPAPAPEERGAPVPHRVDLAHLGRHEPPVPGPPLELGEQRVVLGEGGDLRPLRHGAAAEGLRDAAGPRDGLQLAQLAAVAPVAVREAAVDDHERLLREGDARHPEAAAGAARVAHLLRAAERAAEAALALLRGALRGEPHGLLQHARPEPGPVALRADVGPEALVLDPLERRPPGAAGALEVRGEEPAGDSVHEGRRVAEAADPRGGDRRAAAGAGDLLHGGDRSGRGDAVPLLPRGDRVAS